MTPGLRSRKIEWIDSFVILRRGLWIVQGENVWFNLTRHKTSLTRYVKNKGVICQTAKGVVTRAVSYAAAQEEME